MPDRHALAAYNPQDGTTADLPLDLAAGEIAYVELKLRASGKPARQLLTRLDAAIAQPRVRRCRMLAIATPTASAV